MDMYLALKAIVFHASHAVMVSLMMVLRMLTESTSPAAAVAAVAVLIAATLHSLTAVSDLSLRGELRRSCANRIAHPLS